MNFNKNLSLKKISQFSAQFSSVTESRLTLCDQELIQASKLGCRNSLREHMSLPEVTVVSQSVQPLGHIRLFVTP